VVVDEENEEPRYRLLEPLREFAAERLVADGEQETLIRAHANYFKARSRESLLHSRTAQEAVWMPWYRRNQENMQQAFQWYTQQPDEADTCLQICTQLTRYWQRRGALRTGLHCYALAFAHPGPIRNTQDLVAALHGASVLSRECGEYADARAFLERGLALCLSLPERTAQERLLNALGNLYHEEQDYAAAERYYTESLALRRQSGNSHAIAVVASNLANVLRYRNDYAGALQLYQEALAIGKADGDRRGTAITLVCLGDLHREQSAFEAAQESYIQALRIYQEHPDRAAMPSALEGLAALEAERRHRERAVILYSAGERLRSEIGMPSTDSGREQRERRLAQIAATIAPADYNRLREVGAGLTDTEILAFALEDQTPLSR